MRKLTHQQLAHTLNSCFDSTRSKHLDMINLENDLTLLFILCPLFEFGKLSQSELLKNPGSVSESRIAVKWDATKKIICDLATLLKQHNLGVEATFVFANRGVLLDGDPKSDDILALEKHLTLWKSLALEVTRSQELKGCTFLDFESLDVPMPRFVDPNKHSNLLDNTNSSDLDLKKFTNAIEKTLSTWQRGANATHAQLILNKKNRRTLTRLIKTVGIDTSFCLVSTYMAFDWMIPMLSSNSINVSIERFDPLHGIIHFTKEAEIVPRLEVTT